MIDEKEYTELWNKWEMINEVMNRASRMGYDENWVLGLCKISRIGLFTNSLLKYALSHITELEKENMVSLENTKHSYYLVATIE